MESGIKACQTGFGVQGPHHADCVPQGTNSSPGLPRADPKEGDAPPEEQLPKVIWMSREPPQPFTGDKRFAN